MSPAAVEVSLAPIDVIRPSVPASGGGVVVRAGLEVCRTDARDADGAIVLRALGVVLLAVLLGCPEGRPRHVDAMRQGTRHKSQVTRHVDEMRQGMWMRCDTMCNTMGQNRAVGKGATLLQNRHMQCQGSFCNTVRTWQSAPQCPKHVRICIWGFEERNSGCGGR